MDAALFTKRDKNGELIGICPIHFDEGKVRATKEAAEPLFEMFKADPTVELSSVERQVRSQKVEYCGMQFCETAVGEWIDQDIYIHNKLRHLDTSKLRGLDLDAELNGEAASEFGTTVGR